MLINQSLRSLPSYQSLIEWFMNRYLTTFLLFWSLNTSHMVDYLVWFLEGVYHLQRCCCSTKEVNLSCWSQWVGSLEVKWAIGLGYRIWLSCCSSFHVLVLIQWWIRSSSWFGNCVHSGSKYINFRSLHRLLLHAYTSISSLNREMSLWIVHH